ncbi:putative nitrate/nitrite DNA-binding response regulator [Flavobacteriales bacterium ALC-1]|nr:putative nitrate/nitrite DNA-binding response regulator [Flavobacteriales bacterium ALC-1]
MNKLINVLIVEDEPLIINALEMAFNAISESNGSFDFKIKSANDCDAGAEKIQKAVTSTPFDLVLLDINIPASKDKELLCGEDLGIELKNCFPNVKIIVFTSHNNNFRLNSILKSLNPEGFLIKSDIDFPKLLEAVKSVLDGLPYYSKAILQLMRRHMVNDFTLDKIDRQLLYQISKGAKTRHLHDIVHLSKSAIEHRKRNLKELFEVEDGDDRSLIIKAEERGFI